MKAFIGIVAAVCFCYSAFSAACVHTLLEAQYEQGKKEGVALVYIHMPLKELAEQEI